MRVAAFVRTFPSVSQTFVLNQLTGLGERDCEVEIFAECAEETVVHPGAREFQRRRGITYYHIPQKYLHRVLGGARLWTKFAAQAPVSAARTFNFFRYGVPALSLRLVYQVTAIRNSSPFDILHAHFGPNGLIAAQLRDLGVLRAPLVTTFYGYDLRQQYAAAYRFLFERGELFLALGETMRARLIQLGCDPQKIIVHHLGIDPDWFQSPVRARRGRTHILSIARLVPKKGIEYGIRAVAAVRTRNPDVHYTIVGEGPLRPRLEQLIHTLDVQEDVTLAGCKSQPQIVELLRDSDILLAPSVTAADGDAEGTPVAILEAMAMQLPVISTRHSGIPEIVQDGVNGILVEERDTDALRRALDTLIHSPHLRQEMGAAGRQQVEAQHDIRRLNDQLVGIYRSLRM